MCRPSLAARMLQEQWLVTKGGAEHCKLLWEWECSISVPLLWVYSFLTVSLKIENNLIHWRVS